MAKYESVMSVTPRPKRMRQKSAMTRIISPRVTRFCHRPTRPPGFFLDDEWGGGPSEEAWPVTPRGTGAGRSAGLSAQEVGRMKGNWSRNMGACQAAIVAKGGFNWQLFKSAGAPKQERQTRVSRHFTALHSVLHRESLIITVDDS